MWKEKEEEEAEEEVEKEEEEDMNDEAKEKGKWEQLKRQGIKVENESYDGVVRARNDLQTYFVLLSSVEVFGEEGKLLKVQ